MTCLVVIAVSVQYMIVLNFTMLGVQECLCIHIIEA